MLAWKTAEPLLSGFWRFLGGEKGPAWGNRHTTSQMAVMEKNNTGKEKRECGECRGARICLNAPVLWLKEVCKTTRAACCGWTPAEMRRDSLASCLGVSRPRGSSNGKESAYQCRRHRSRGFHPWVGKIPWRRGDFFKLANLGLPTPTSLVFIAFVKFFV